jgi:hypothetical protein
MAHWLLPWRTAWGRDDNISSIDCASSPISGVVQEDRR